MNVILAHEHADFDAIASLLAASKLDAEAVPVLPGDQNSNVAAFLALFVGGLPFRHRADVDFSAVESVTLVDTQKLPQIKGLSPDVHLRIIDHHPASQDLPDSAEFSGETVGAATTLLVERLQDAGIGLTALEATLLALGIYEDTGSLTYSGTTARDARAAAWLIEQQAALDTVRRFLEPPLTDEQQKLFEALTAAAETRIIQGYTIVVCAAKADNYVAEVAAVAHRLNETLEPDGLFVLVEMSTALLLVCRSATDAVNAAEVAKAFGGGGHRRAASASLHEIAYEAARSQLWSTIATAVLPAVRVADLMSRGLQTVDAAKPLDAVARQMRRIGHEGFPVVENGQLVGLLTRRDADRALEHGLGHLPVRDVMTSGNVRLRPEDSVAVLEQTMVESGWGQVPVSDDGKLIGIVTRTDLIQHWAQTHPPAPATEAETLGLDRVKAVLGAGVAALIEAIAAHADAQNVTLYLVGGVVRDLLLRRPNDDVDFVVETDAIALATSLRERYGGTVSAFRPFGTAKWTLDAEVARRLQLTGDGLPDHVDFATARNEFYEQPAALPTVYDGSIKLDLLRRDFTINTLAAQFSPMAASGRILNFYSGLADLHNGLIRVLHNLSFVEDPTRMLRAVRFEQRLGFQIETRTAELLITALPMLRRITGERVRNELSLILREREPERPLLELQQRGILAAIHPALIFDARIAALFQSGRTQSPPWPMAAPDPVALNWHLIATVLPADALAAICERLLMPQGQAETMLSAARVIALLDWLDSADLKPSQIDARLGGIADIALFAAWLAAPTTSRSRSRIKRFASTWRDVRPVTNGHTLQAMKLRPGPCYTVILSRLRAARLDSEVDSDEGERQLLQRLIDEGVCDGSA